MMPQGARIGAAHGHRIPEAGQRSRRVDLLRSERQRKQTAEGKCRDGWSHKSFLLDSLSKVCIESILSTMAGTRADMEKS